VGLIADSASNGALTRNKPDGSTDEKKELIWGYGSGVAMATTRDYGDVVLAEYTQPFNETVTMSVLLFG
jgi:hypothetical protein